MELQLCTDWPLQPGHAGTTRDHYVVYNNEFTAAGTALVTSAITASIKMIHSDADRLYKGTRRAAVAIPLRPTLQQPQSYAAT